MSTSTALVASSSPSPAPPEEEAELPVDLSQLPSLPVAKSLVLINNFVANTTRFLNHIAHECEERITRVSDNVTRVEILLAILEAKLNSIPDLNVTDAEVAAAADGNQTLNTNLIDLGISDQDLPSMEVAEADGTLLLPPPPSAEEVVTFSEGMAPPPPPPMDGMDMALIVPPPPPPPPPGLSSPVGSIPPPPPSVMDDFDEDEVKSDGPPLLKLKDDPLFAKYFTMRRLGIPEQVIEHKLIMDGMDTNILHMDPEGPSPSGGVAPTMDAGPQGPILPIMAPPPPQSIGDSDLEDDRIELPPPPPSLLHPKEVERSQSRNIGMPFPPPPPPISPTASIDRPASLFGDGPPVAPPPPPPPPSLSHLGPQAPFENEVESSSDDDIEEFEVDGPAETTGNTGVMKLKDDPAFEKYFKMRKLGLPDGVIQHKLMMDGISLDILDMDPEGPSPNATDGSPAANPTKVPPARPAGGLPPPPVKKFDNAEDDFDSPCLNFHGVVGNMFLKPKDDENVQPNGNEDSTQLQQMLTSCMINRQVLFCVAGVLIGIPISIKRKSYLPFAALGVLGSFVDYSIPYTTDCRLIHNALLLALQKERQRDALESVSMGSSISETEEMKKE